MRLGQLVVRTGTFSLGSGDVGRPLGTGVSGIRALAREMKADSFRFLGWDYIPTPIADSCTMQKVEVEFIDTGGKRLYPVTFTFRDGRIVDAAGWSRSFESGSIANARH